MAKATTIIHQAIDLVNEKGKEAAILQFENKLKELRLARTKDFSAICKISGCETAIEFIKALVN